MGDDISTVIATAHEVERSVDVSKANGMHRQMDFANNVYGRYIGRTYGDSPSTSGVTEYGRLIEQFIESGLACVREPGNYLKGTEDFSGPFVDEGRCGL